MKKRYSEEQIVKMLKEGEVGGVSETSRRHGVNVATFYSWRKKYQDLGTSEVRKLKALEDENRRLKKLVAEKELDLEALKALLEKYGEAR